MVWKVIKIAYIGKTFPEGSLCMAIIVVIAYYASLTWTGTTMEFFYLVGSCTMIYRMEKEEAANIGGALETVASFQFSLWIGCCL